MAQTILTHAAASQRHPLIGVRSRVGGIGQEYEVVDVVDEVSALIFPDRYQERVLYPIVEIEADMAGTTGMSRYSKLLGQVRSIGPDGPKYEVVSVDEQGGAQIWIIPNDENDPYNVEDILLDPFAD